MKKIVIVNQAVNYLTIGFCNAFAERFETVALITGSIHVQGEELNPDVKVSWINRWKERPSWKKLFSYLIGSAWICVLLLFKYRKYDVFFVSVPPMAYLLSVVLPNRCSAVIWDVFPDAFRITGMSTNHWLYRIWARLNVMAFQKMHRLFTISERMGDLLEQYTDRDRILIQPIWSIFQENSRLQKQDNPFVQQQEIADKFVVQYSGNIGLTHKVEVMVELAERLREEKDILFQIIGRGPRKPVLERLVLEKQLPNCVFLPFQSDEMFPFSLSAADLGVVVLDELTSKGSVPSKSYNLMSYGIPSLYIASLDSQLQLYADQFGHARCFSESELKNAAQFILMLKNDRNLQRELSQNALKAARHFKRNNADKFVALYLSEPINESIEA